MLDASKERSILSTATIGTVWEACDVKKIHPGNSLYISSWGLPEESLVLRLRPPGPLQRYAILELAYLTPKTPAEPTKPEVILCRLTGKDIIYAGHSLDELNEFLEDRRLPAVPANVNREISLLESLNS